MSTWRFTAWDSSGRAEHLHISTVMVKQNTPGSVIEHSQHGYNAIGVAIGAPDVAACGPNVVHG